MQTDGIEASFTASPHCVSVTHPSISFVFFSVDERASTPSRKGLIRINCQKSSQILSSYQDWMPFWKQKSIALSWTQVCAIEEIKPEYLPTLLVLVSAARTQRLMVNQQKGWKTPRNTVTNCRLPHSYHGEKALPQQAGYWRQGQTWGCFSLYLVWRVGSNLVRNRN